MENSYQRIYLDKDLTILDSVGSLFDDLGIFNIEKKESIADHLPKSWHKSFSENCSQALENGKTTTYEYQIRTKSPGTLKLSVTFEPDAKEGYITGIIATFGDAVAIKRSMHHAILQNKMSTMSDLAANIAKELNNPLSSLLNRIGGLLMQKFTARDLGRLRTELLGIQESIYSMSLITNALEAFSNETTSGFRFLNINTIIEKSVELVKLLRLHSNVTYQLKLSDYLPRVKGNEITLEQSLINILKNAIEAMPDGGTLTVQSYIDKAMPDYIHILIKDTGIGIPGDNLEKIFDPFFKTKKNDHSGLGLTISYGIIADHGGVLEISSKIDKGTKVSIFLPTTNNIKQMGRA